MNPEAVFMLNYVVHSPYSLISVCGAFVVALGVLVLS